MFRGSNISLLAGMLMSVGCGGENVDTNNGSVSGFALCVDEGDGNNWGVNPATNEGCWITPPAFDANITCNDDGDGDNWGVNPDNNRGCWISPPGETEVEPSSTPEPSAEPEPTMEPEGAMAPAQNLRMEVYSSTTAELFWDRPAPSAGYARARILRNGTEVAQTEGVSHYDNQRTAGQSYTYQVILVHLDGTESLPAEIGDEVEPEPTVVVEPEAEPSVVVEPETEPEPTVAPSGCDAHPLAPGEVLPPLPQTDGPITGPSASDPFGFYLEAANPVPLDNVLPDAPAHMRVDLVGNNWAILNWAPSADYGNVVAYKIHRSDGHVYTVAGDQMGSIDWVQDEIDRYFRLTSFTDCNYTRFNNELHNCAEFGPNPGDVFSYYVTAIDNDGNESDPSDSVTVYYAEDGGPVVPYSDFYLDPNDRFAQCNDLEETRFFLDEYTLMFSDEFNGNSIDGTKWKTRLSWGDNVIINGEQQYFIDTQSGNITGHNPFQFTGDALRIRAVPTPPSVKPNLPSSCQELETNGKERCLFLSGALSTYDEFGFTYGYVESRMKVNGDAGGLSSFYLYNRWPGNGANRQIPEIDIVEYLGENQYGDEVAFQTYHYNDVVHDEIRSSPSMEEDPAPGTSWADGFHTYGVLWEPQLVIWYIDGQEVRRISGRQVSRQQMNIILYLVAGSEWALTPDADAFPMDLEIDYVRAYQRDAFKGNAAYGG